LAVNPVILSGGVGSRLWPMSRGLLPKQFLPLMGARTMIQETALRVAGEGFAAPTVVCNQEHRFLAAEQLRALQIEPRAIVLEPVGRNTAPAAAIASLMLKDDPEALVLLLPADHAVMAPEAFRDAVRKALPAAMRGALVTFGVVPTSPETGYGYIRAGAALADAEGCRKVDRFVEKPDLATAETYVASGEYYWNAGMFLFRADAFLAELRRLEPAMFAACEAALAKGRKDLDFLRLDEAAFGACPAQSIDYAVMEHTGDAAVVPVEMGWSDIGSWRSLWDLGARDGADNVAIGDVTAVGTERSYLRSEGPMIAAAGIKDMIVVATKDAVLVASREHAQNVKKVVEALEARGASEHIHHPRVLRPWGSYETMDLGPNYQIKRIVVRPGARLSLQKHHKRAEHWVVVAGKARVTRDEAVFDLAENESTYIPLGAWHRLENPGAEPLVLVEVQCGSYLGEDDIVRREDDYGR